MRDRGKNIVAAMHAAGGLQFGVVERLRAQADAIDAGGEPGGGLFGRDGFGIGFERSCPSARHRRRQHRDRAGELRAHGVEDAREVGGIEEAGRAAAEVDRVDGCDRAKMRRDSARNATAFFGAGHQHWQPQWRVGVEAAGGVQGAPVADFAFDGAGVRGIGRGRGDSGMEVTVGALGLAERHLDVDAESW